MPGTPIKYPSVGRLIKSGQAIKALDERARKAAILTGQYPLEVMHDAGGQHIIDRRLPVFWVVVYKLQSGSGVAGAQSAFPQGTPDYAYDGYKLLVDSNLVVQQDSRQWFDRNRYPLIEMTENPDVPDSAVALAVPGPDASHYEFLWTGEMFSTEHGSATCDVRISDFFRRTVDGCGIRDGCLRIVDANGHPTPFHIQLQLD